MNKGKPNNLKAVMTVEGLDYKELSTSSGASISIISKIANESVNSTAKTRYKILKGLNKISSKKYKYFEIYPNHEEK